MKKIFNFLITAVFAMLFFVACANPLIKDPRLYNSKTNTAGGGANGITPVTPEPELNLGDEETDIELAEGETLVLDFDQLDEWFNNPNCNGDATSPKKLDFPASDFNNMAITGWFNKENVPTYTMKSANVWGSCTNTTRNEYVHSNAPNTEGQGFKINGVTYYQYRGKNPCYAGDGNYNNLLQTTNEGNPKLSRFYFYRFTGKGAGVQWLDNFLIAVDTYSKFIFAFSKPVAFSSMGAPTKWEATDAKPYNGKNKIFYQYDPVGYVTKNPDNSYSVELYKWFKDNLAKGNYEGNINPNFTNVASKNPNGAGKTPFQHKVVKQKVFNEAVMGQSFVIREDAGINPNFATDGQGYGDNIITLNFSKDGFNITVTKTAPNGEVTEIITGKTSDPVDTVNNVKYTFVDNDAKEYIATFRIDTLGKILTAEINGKKQNYINTIYFKDKGISFFAKAKGLKFTGRTTNEYGDDLDLYSFNFSQDGKSVDVTKTTWGKEQEPFDALPVKSLASNPAMGTCNINGMQFTFDVQEENGQKVLHANDNLKCTQGEFNDPTPTFANRVKDNPKFESKDKKHSFEFLNGYQQVKVDGVVYVHDTTISVNGRNRSFYNRQTGFLSWDFIGLELQNNDKTIKMTEIYQNKNNLKWNKLINEAEKVDNLTGKSFLDIVKGQTYSFRELDGYTGFDGQGYGLKLYTYQFSTDGLNVTYTETLWGASESTPKDSKTSKVIINPNDRTKASVIINGQTVELSLNDSTTVLYTNKNSTPDEPYEKTLKGDFIHNFKNFDLGPSFLNRVKSSKYTGKATYNFNDKGKLTISNAKEKAPFFYNFNGTYTYNESVQERNKAIYVTYGGVFGNTPFYHGVILSNNDQNIIITSYYDKNALDWNTLRYNSATRQK